MYVVLLKLRGDVAASRAPTSEQLSEALKGALTREDHEARPVGRETSTEPQNSLEEDFAEFFPILKSGNDNENTPLGYMKSRGFDWLDLERYNVHFALSGRYSYRVIIPCYENFRLVYFTARSYINQQPTYLNPANSRCPLNRNEVVFNIDNVVPGEPVVICEGQLNAMTVHGTAVATLGKAVTTAQLQRLLSKHAGEYICALDRDAWTENVSLANRIESTGHKVSLVQWPEGHDAASLGREECSRVIAGRIQVWEAPFIL